MKANKKDKKCGIYLIRNTVNNKVYIGKSKNIYKRICQHISDLNKNDFKKENSYLIHSWNKYGRNSFEYIILEYLELNETVLSKRELYWMKVFKSLNKNFGYNLRSDSNTKMITHKETSKKISERLKKEWLNGVRDNHSKKLSDNWKINPERKSIQSKIMSKSLTKYNYNIFDNNMNFIECCNYKRLVQLNLKNVIATFLKKKTNKVNFKNFFIEKVTIDDIVRSSKKFEKN